MKRFDEIEQRSPAWFFKRARTITGTRAKGISGTVAKRKDVEYEILAEMLSTTQTEDEQEENPMARGTRLEPDAIAEFELEHDLKVEATGFCENDNNPLIANSPDGIISDTDDTEMIEVKCPGGKNYVKYVIENKIPEEYVYQVIQYFIVNEKLNKLWFVIYNPNIACHPMHVLTVLRSTVEEAIKLGVENQTAVLQEVSAMYRAFPGVNDSFNKL